MSERRPGPLDLLSKTITRLAARGPGEVMALAGNRLRDTVTSEGSLVILQRAAGDGPGERDDITLRRATPEDGVRYARDIGTDSPGTFTKRVTPRTWCYVVEADDARLLHATWCTIAGAWTREIAACLVPPRDSAYVYESFTRSDARGKGIYPFALRGIASDLAATGTQRVWVGVEADNFPSLRAVAKAGFEAASQICFERRWGRVRVTSDAPPDGLGIQPECPR
ncbi:MAG TPA: hypothetical protein VG929_02500 [Actinomycetota bacterium]|nr:hypothetical protein [Actinomycetota bacterium]